MIVISGADYLRAQLPKPSEKKSPTVHVDFFLATLREFFTGSDGVGAGVYGSGE